MKNFKEKIIKIFSKILENIKKKWLADTFMTILLIAIIFTVYFGINVLMSKTNFSDIDVTKSKKYSLSDETISKINEIEKDVTITLVNFPESSYVTDYAKKYEKQNENIKVDVIEDLSTRPDISKEYELTDTSDLIIIKSGELENTLSSYDLYTYDYSTGEELDKSEEAFTNAILNVTIDVKPKIYFLTGHEYYTLDEAFASLKNTLEGEANEVSTIDILSAGKIPEDCSCLVITTLKEDISELEKDKILEYINNGGKMLILADPNLERVQLVNFKLILEAFGITMQDGIIIEQKSENMVTGSPDFIISEIQAGLSITQDFSKNIKGCFIDCAKIEFKDDETLTSLGITKEILASSSESAFLRNDFTASTFSRISSDVDAGESILAAVATKTINEEENKSSQLIIFSNALFATDMEIGISQQYYMYALDLYNNKDIALNSISYLTQRNDTLTIRKDSDEVQFTVTENQSRTILFIVFALPVFIIISGIVVWQVRRRKR